MNAKKLNREQWYELETQYNKTPAQPEDETVPGEHPGLIPLLGFRVIRSRAHSGVTQATEQKRYIRRSYFPNCALLNAE